MNNIFQPSIIEQIKFQNKKFYIKRDDLLHKDFSGNKARKFQYFLENDFPYITKVISHGSNQSNAMYSLSVLAKMKKWEFEYYVDHIPSYLEQNPQGNYKYAIQNGMKVHQKEVPQKFKDNELFITEGGAVKQAQFGIEILANEIMQWAEQNGLTQLNVFLPSGTGTTALYLQKYLSFDVYTCACVGDEKYLIQQFNDLERNNHPIILKTQKKFHFGKLYKQNFEIWKKIKKQTNIEFDLLYDPVGWQTLLQSNLVTNDIPILYIHQGGILGNETMLQRYQRKYPDI